MTQRFGRMLHLYWKDGLGLGLFLAWVYCTLFGCGLACDDMTLAGKPTTYGLERIWLFNGIAEAVGGLMGIGAAALFGKRGSKTDDRLYAPAALVLALLASTVLWIAWLDRTVLFDRLYWIGGILAGLSAAFFTMVWGRRLSSFDEARIEFVVPLAFVVSFALYLVELVGKSNNAIDLVTIAFMAVGSFAFFVAARRADDPNAAAPKEQRPIKHDWRGLPSFGVLAFASWVQLAYFRVLSTPALAGNRFNHYLWPFLLACIVSIVMLVICIRISRYLNITLAYRWSMPLFVLSYVPLLIDYDDPTLRMIGYAVNFLGMFGVQFGCWLGASKFVRRSRSNPVGVFACYALGEGLGIFAGCLIGLYNVAEDHTMIAVVSFMLLGLVQLAIMFVGFNPNWVLRRTRGLGEPLADPRIPAMAGAPSPQDGASVRDDQRLPDKTMGAAGATAPTVADSLDESVRTLDELFRQQALALQAAYALTNRETEVAELLLAGRSRPFIRDELFISLNTVSVHVRSIFAKCDVHSQQELIDLARDGR